MRQWLIPAIVLLAVGGMGLGVGWSINEWQDGGDSAPVATSTAGTGQTEAELDAQRCGAALQAAGNVAPQSVPQRPDIKLITIPDEIKNAISRYCH